MLSVLSWLLISEKYSAAEITKIIKIIIPMLIIIIIIIIITIIIITITIIIITIIWGGGGWSLYTYQRSQELRNDYTIISCSQGYHSQLYKSH